MRQGHYTVTSRDVQEHAAGLIENQVGLKKRSGQCTVAVLLHVLLAAAARLASPFCSLCADAQGPLGRTRSPCDFGRLALLRTKSCYLFAESRQPAERL